MYITINSILKIFCRLGSLIAIAKSLDWLYIS